MAFQSISGGQFLKYVTLVAIVACSLSTGSNGTQAAALAEQACIVVRSLHQKTNSTGSTLAL